MTDAEPRPIRDILAEALWLEPDILRRPSWARWSEIAPDECERYRERADHLIRLVGEMGAQITTAGGEPKPRPHVPSGVVWRYHIVGQNGERIVRKGPLDDWYVATVADGQETIEHTFQLGLTHVRSGMVLTGDPGARSIQNLGKELSAALEIYRLCAQAAGGQQS